MRPNRSDDPEMRTHLIALHAPVHDLDVCIQVLLCPKAFVASWLGACERTRRCGKVRARMCGEVGIAEVGFRAGGAFVWALDPGSLAK